MDEYIPKYSVRLIESDSDAYYENWNDDYERGFQDAIVKVLEIPPADVQNCCQINYCNRIEDNIYEALRILDAINTSGRLDYGDYCELHDAISLIYSEKNDRDGE